MLFITPPYISALYMSLRLAWCSERQDTAVSFANEFLPKCMIIITTLLQVVVNGVQVKRIKPTT